MPPYHHWKSGPLSAVLCSCVLGLAAMLVFGVFEQWPKRLPRWIERWVLQVVGVALSMPILTGVMYWISTASRALPVHDLEETRNGFIILMIHALLIAPWVALGALVRQREALARHQALEFDLARSELERQAVEARLRLLQAQVAPHFLFNTLANVQALVDAGSPQARVVLRSLVAYLRAAVPRLNEPVTTLGQEVELVRAYLELMRMRLPDRLAFELNVEDAARGLRCPPMTLLTLVENAVRHGIDPSEEGGSITVDVRIVEGRCWIRVADSGVGLQASGRGLGTGLAALRERLALVFGDAAMLRVRAREPKGVVSELEFPAREAAG